MKNLTKIIICLSFILLSGQYRLCAQQDTQYTQYMYAANVINPAYVGTRDVLTLTSQLRSQWTGLEGAPKTFNLTSNGPLRGETFGRMGVGINAVSESIGPSISNTIAGDLSYRIDLGTSTFLNFGIKGGIKLFNIDVNKLSIYNTTDESFLFNVDDRLSPIIGSGMYLYSNAWYFGVSVPNFLTTTFYDDVAVSAATERMTFYAMGGYVFHFSNDFKFKPTFLVKYTGGAPAAVDVSANVLLSNRFTLGASYRYGSAVSALAGFQINGNIFFGYAYDMDTSSLGAYNGGSHGVLLRFDLGIARDIKLLSPRFF